MIAAGGRKEPAAADSRAATAFGGMRSDQTR